MWNCHFLQISGAVTVLAVMVLWEPRSDGQQISGMSQDLTYLGPNMAIGIGVLGFCLSGHRVLFTVARSMQPPQSLEKAVHIAFGITLQLTCGCVVPKPYIVLCKKNSSSCLLLAVRCQPFVFDCQPLGSFACM